MSELFGISLILGLVGFIVMVVGHGMWLLVAAIFRAMSGHKSALHRNGLSCPVCSTPLDHQQRCGHCGWNARESAAARRRRNTREMLAVLVRDELIEPKIQALLINAMEKSLAKERRRTVASARPSTAEEGLLTAELVDEVPPGAAPGRAPVDQSDRTSPARRQPPLHPISPAAPAARESKPADEKRSPVRPAAAQSLTPEVLASSPSSKDALEATVHARAEHYQAERATSPPSPVRPPAPPSRPSIPWSRWLSAFMEEKNIRWGELLGGLLIVTGSVALVVSFWSEIAARPFLKFGLLNGITAVMFLLGLHVASHWKLPTTSQGILLTSTLLVPLNFLAIAAFSEGSTAGSLGLLTGEFVSAVVLGTLVYLAARVLIPQWAIWATIGVMVPSVLQLVLRRYLSADVSVWQAYLFTVLISLPYVVCQIVPLASMRAERELDEPKANVLLKHLGLLLFSLLVGSSILLLKAERPLQLIRWLTPMSAVLAVPLMASGATLWKRCEIGLASMRTTGAALVTLGAFVLTAAGVMSWPQPATMLALTVIGFVLLTFAAEVVPVRESHVVAAFLMSAAAVLAVLLVSGNLTWTVDTPQETLRALLQPFTGRVLTGVSLGAILVAGVLTHRKQQIAGYAYLAAAVAAAVLSLVLLIPQGLGQSGDPEYLTWILALYAVFVVAFAWLFRSPLAMFVSGALLQVAFVQGIVYGLDSLELHDPWTLSFAANASVMVLLAILLRWRLGPDDSEVPDAAAFCSLAGVLIALLTVLGLGTLGQQPVSVPHLAWISVILLSLAWTTVRYELWIAFQGVLLLAAVVALDHQLERTDWYRTVAWGWTHPLSLQYQAILLSIAAWASYGLRVAAGKIQSPAGGLTFKAWMVQSEQKVIEAVLIGLGLGVLWFTSVYAVVPGVSQELSLRMTTERIVPEASRFYWGDLPADSASGLGVWLLLGLLGAFLVASKRASTRAWDVRDLVLVTAPMMFLVAAPWQSQVATASALRWTSAGYFAIGSGLIWSLPQFKRWLGSGQAHGVSLRRGQRLASVWLTVFSLVPCGVMAVDVVSAAISLQPPVPSQARFLLGAVLVFLALVIGLSMVDRMGRARATKWTRVVGSLVVLSALPVLAVSVFFVGNSLANHPVIGPEVGSLFERMGLAASYAVPLLIVAVTVVGHAFYFRSDRIAFAGGLLLNASFTTLYLLALGTGWLRLEQWVELTQLNGSVAALYGLGWMAVGGRIWRQHGRWRLADGWHRTQQGIVVGLALFPVIAMCTVLWVNPSTSTGVTAAAGLWGWITVVLTAAILFVYDRWTSRSISATSLVVVVGLGLLTFAFQCHAPLSLLPTSSWLAFHLVALGMASVAVLVTLVQRYRRPDGGLQRPFEIYGADAPWITGLRWISWATLILYGLRGLDGDPLRPWWSMGTFLMVAALSVECGQRLRRQRYFGLALVLLNVASSSWYVTSGWQLTGSRQWSMVLEFIHVNLLSAAIAVPGLVSLGRQQDESPRRLLTVQQLVMPLLVIAYAFGVGLGILSDVLERPLADSTILAGLTCVAILVASCSRFWDLPRTLAAGYCYLGGMLAVGWTLDRLDLESLPLTWLSALVLSAYGLATSYAWSRRNEINSALTTAGVPNLPTTQLGSRAWLVPCNGLLAAVVAWLGVWVQFTCDEYAIRLAASQAIGAQAFALGLLARGRREVECRYVALCFGVLAAITFGWSWSEPTAWHERWLDDCVVVAVASLMMSVFYGLGLTKIVRRENDWTVAGRRLMPALVGLSIVSLFVVLASEVALYVNFGFVSISLFGVLAVLLALIVSALACLAAAVVPGRDPLGWSEKQRTIYVYAAEGLIAAICLHLRLTLPELFSGIVAQYWTLVIMAIAFLGVGLSEWFRRRKQIVLAEPLERTGILLPLLPIVGFWVSSQEVHYSLLLLAAGLLYSVLSVTRRSFGFGVLAAIAANGGLWYFLQRDADVSILVHPQLWLIPLAVSVLIAAYLNREQLSKSQMTSVRYACALMIYISSTADIFLVGVAQQPFLPVVLASFSIVGILAGIMFRVRAFLFLGLGFLFVSLMTIVWHAAVDLQHTWLWWVFFIVAGALIFLLFAIFERKRQEVLRVIEQVRQWDA